MGVVEVPWELMELKNIENGEKGSVCLLKPRKKPR